MINASELRIGNIITMFGENIRITGITFDSIYNKDGFCINNSDTFLPIKLNKFIFIEIGLIKIEEDLYYIPISSIKSELHFEYFNDGFVIPILKNDFGETILNKIAHVHELQNLYFTLSGYELIRTEL